MSVAAMDMKPFGATARRWSRTLSDGAGDAMTRIGVVAAAIFAGAAFIWPIVVGTGATSNALDEIKHHLAGIDHNMEVFQARLDNGVRIDQLVAIDGHLSQVDHTINSMNDRINALLDRLAHAESRLDGIDHASQAHLK